MEKIFVLGAGTMGAGIVQAFAQKGYEVIVRDIKDEFVERGLAGINKNLSKFKSLSIAPLLADAIKRIYDDKPLSSLF